MTMRSWYMPKGSADQLAALVDDIHFATRLPKHLIMGAAVNVFERHRGEIEAEARSVAAMADKRPGPGIAPGSSTRADLPHRQAPFPAARTERRRALGQCLPWETFRSVACGFSRDGDGDTAG
jgi:hypothetical protein